MNKRVLLTSLVLILASVACNLPSNAPTPIPEATATPLTPLDTPTSISTSIPTETPLPTLTPTPTIPIAWPNDKGVNCRYGPGTEWLAVGALLVGQTATIQGRNEDSSWWYVNTPDNPGSPCWVAASVTNTAGNLSSLSVINPPHASVIKVNVKLDPKEIKLPGCVGPVPPISIKGVIETNGPTKVEYYFETEQGGSMPYQTIKFSNADSKTVEATFTPPAGKGTFWVRLIIKDPNEIKDEAKYTITCP